MKYNEIEKCVNFNEKEVFFMPNEIFNELKESIHNTQQLTFAYSYLYLITYLYRYCKYGINGLIDGNKIREILGYSPNTRSINPLIKKGGLLDQMEFTSTQKDYPIAWSYDENEVNFMMFSDLEEEEKDLYKSTMNRKFSVKMPTRAFYRHVHDEECKKAYDEDGEIDGTFFNIDNTHSIPFEVFMFCMDNDKIGCGGFYLYSYLKHRCDIFNWGYDCSVESMAEETGIPLRTLTNYLDVLKKYKMIDCMINQKSFVLGLPNKERMANTYSIRTIDEFSDKPQSYAKIKVQTRAEYYKEKKEEMEMLKGVLEGESVDIPLESIPF